MARTAERVTPELPRLPDDDMPVWKFMQPSRFAEMIKSGKMWFPSVALLRERDPYEGIYPHQNKSHHAQVLAVDENTYSRIFYVSCWHASQWESALLWSAYASESDGVVVKSSIGRLKRGIPNQIPNVASGMSDVVLAPVRYINRREVTLPTGNARNLFNLMYQKQRCFSLEQEVRAGFLMYPDKGVADLENDVKTADRGKLVDCDFEEIIEEVRFAPLAAPSLLSEVQSLKQRLGSPWGLRRSAIVDDSAD